MSGEVGIICETCGQWAHDLDNTCSSGGHIAQIVVYPVGWIAAWRQRRMGRMKSEWRYFKSQVRKGNWRAVHNTFNGYLAEVQYSSMHHTRAGHGWTKRRALADLGRHLGELNSDALD